MNGRIVFETLAQLAEFLREFTPSTATFRVDVDATGIELVFTGGY